MMPDRNTVAFAMLRDVSVSIEKIGDLFRLHMAVFENGEVVGTIEYAPTDYMAVVDEFAEFLKGF